MLLSDVCLMSNVCLSRTIGNNSRTERPRKTKIGTQVVHVTRDSKHHFQGQKVKSQGHQAGLLTAAFTHRQLQRSALERIERGKLLLRCRLQAWRSARRREALRRPHGEERGGGISRRHAHSSLKQCARACVRVTPLLKGSDMTTKTGRTFTGAILARCPSCRGQ